MNGVEPGLAGRFFRGHGGGFFRGHGGGAGGWRRRGVTLVAGVVAAAAVLTGQPAVSGASTVEVRVAGGAMAVVEPPVPGVPVGPVVVRGVEPMPAYVPGPVVWPGAADARVVPVVGEAARAAGTVVSLTPVSSVLAGQSWRVQAEGREVAERLGGVGVAFAVSQAGLVGPSVVADQPRVTVDVSGFSDAFGGGFATRLRLVEVPLCAFEAARAGREPEAGCDREPRVLPTLVDPLARTLSADVTVLPREAMAEAAGAVPSLPGSAWGAGGVSGRGRSGVLSEPVGPAAGGSFDSGSGAVAAPVESAYVVASGTGGQEGDYSATPLTTAGAWSVGLGAGSFQYSYRLPAAAAVIGSVPELSLGYSSASVDGMTAGDNSQASQVGSGWDLGLPFIERQYRPCSLDGHAGMGDLCWAGGKYQIVLNGKSSTLVRDTTVSVAGRKVFRLKDDPGWRLELYTNPTNSWNPDDDGESWDVYTPDGTKYVFGRGYANTSGSNVATYGTWTVPVFGDDSGEPCYNATLALAWCQQAWRWNLELVLDLKGVQTAYYYQQETNEYRRNGTTDTKYVRGGFVSAIEYDSHFGTGTPSQARVDFVNEPRCTQRATGLPDPTGTCASFGPGNESSYPDVPMDLVCAPSMTCTQESPSFFSHYLIREVVAQRKSGTSWVGVESARIGYQLPDPTDGTSPSLWLSRIKRTGHAGGTVALPLVDFGSALLDNRVDYDTSAGVAPLKKYRVATVLDELAGRTEVVYGHGAAGGCTAVEVGASTWRWDTNVKECFPRWWSPAGSAAGFGVFHKYVVKAVKRVNVFPSGTFSGSTTGSPIERTTYTYEGDAGWTKPIAPLANQATVSYSDWRGYGRVVTDVHTDAAYRGTTSSGIIRRSSDLFYRGLDDKPMADGTTKDYAVTTSQGVSSVDGPHLQGMLREHREFLWTSGAFVEERATTHAYATARPAILAGTSPDPARDSYLMVESGLDERQRVVVGGVASYRVIGTDRAYNTYGQVLDVDYGSTTADHRCTQTRYAGDAAGRAVGKIAYPGRVTVRAGACGGTGAILSQGETFYDGGTTIDSPITRANPTTVVTAKDGTGTTISSSATTTATFDSYGRAVTTTDPLGRVTTTTYSGVTAATQTVAVKNALGHVTTTTLGLHRLAPVTVVDANGNTTAMSYDPLGRISRVARPGDTIAAPTTAFAYQVNSDRPHRVTTQTRKPGGGFVTSYAFIDSLGRTRQVQSVAPTSPYNGQDVTQLVNTRYTEAGQVEGVSNPTAAFGTAGAAMITVAAASMSETRTHYDTMSRPVQSSLWRGTKLWDTDITYLGYAGTITIPPVGGVTVATTTDALGRVTARTDGAGGTTATTSFTYDRADRVTTITDPAGQVTTRAYNLFGLVTTSTDPDAGAITTSYDNAGNPTLLTRSDGSQISTAYDALGRPTTTQGRTSSTGAYTTLVSRTHDTAPGGKGLPAATTTYEGTAAYTTAVSGYDTWGLPTGSTTTVPAIGGLTAPQSWTTSLTYDAGQSKTITYPAIGGLPAETVTTGYTSLGLVSTLSGAAAYLTGTGYNGVSQVTSRTLAAAPSPITRNYTYDSATARLEGVATSVGATTVQDDTLAWNNAGGLTHQLDTLTATRTCHTYDPLNRLTHSWTTADTGCADADTTTAAGPAGYNTSWAYTPAGNITSARRTTGTTTYSYGDTSHPHAVTTAGGTNYGYDSQGRQTSRAPATGTATTLTWDLLGTLKSATTGTATTRYVHTATGERLARITPDGTATIYLGGQEVDIRNGTETTARRYYAAGGATIAIRTPAALTWQLNDRQNGVDLQVTNGTTTTRRAYHDPFGNPRTGTATLATDKGWLGKTTDPTTGLTHLGARYYDTTLGRFLTPDPLNVQTTSQTPNPYSYSVNNPVMFTDTTGLEPKWINGSWNDGPGCGGICRSSTSDSTKPPQTKPTTSSRGAVLRHPDRDTELAQSIGCACTSYDDARDYLDYYEAEHWWYDDNASPESQEMFLQIIGVADVRDCFAMADPGACGWAIVGITPMKPLKWLKLVDEAIVAANGGVKAIEVSTRVAPWAGSSLSRLSTGGEKMYRVWGGGADQAGAWLTPIRPSSAAAAREGLALPAENAATYVSEVTLPAGVRMQVGTAGSAFGQPDGWAQAQLLERIPLSSFGKGVPLP